MTDVSDMRFPSDFVWGAATASYQIEGAAQEDGRGESIWDRFCRTPGKVWNGATGDVACDHYHRYRDDVALMRDLEIEVYRFSVAWPRILPQGRGAVNADGLDFYDRLVDELLENGIEPYPTLYHWDLPQALEDEGGWTNRDTVDAFAGYVETVVRRLGDRVTHWITHNEPKVVSWTGYGQGRHAPGRTGDTNALAAAHHLLLSHGRATRAIRSVRPDAQVGITVDIVPVYPASESDGDQEAARIRDGRDNRWFLEPVLCGSYPADMVALLEPFLPAIVDGDMETIAAPIDFLGVNNYSRSIVRAGPEVRKPVSVRPEGGRFTNMDWEVYPDALYELLVRVHRDYHPRRLYVTENGAAFPDVRVHDGSVPDPERRDYLEQHLASCARAVADGVPLAGYFVWSLLDNFEWAHGYSQRFGIVYVDYPTQQRIPKESAYWYRDFIRQQAAACRAQTA
ncbi:MAG TPA: GH1 family beta-glucosidase [Chloroflexota bacterium]|nr:GH1 family beta-glucosidase [Chloroflexota bacterium]